MDIIRLNGHFLEFLKSTLLEELEFYIDRLPFLEVIEKIDQLVIENKGNDSISFRDFISLRRPLIGPILDIKLFQGLQMNECLRSVKAKDLKRYLGEWRSFLIYRHRMTIFASSMDFEVLTSDNFINWILDELVTCRVMENWPQDDKLVFVEAFSEKCIFFLSSNSNSRNRKINIIDFLLSPLFEEFQALFIDDSNMFGSTIQWVNRVGKAFFSEEMSQWGKMNKEEFLKYGEGDLNPRLVDVYFESLEDPERMNFRDFIRFHLAYENMSNIHGARFFFQLLCIDCKSYIDEASVRYFLTGIISAYEVAKSTNGAGSNDGPNFNVLEQHLLVDHLTEMFFDMTNCCRSKEISLDVILNCGFTERFLLHLISVKVCLDIDDDEEDENDEATQT